MELAIIYATLSIGLGLCFFLIPLWAYRKGLKDGISLGEGKRAIEPIQTPVQAVQKAVDDRKQAKEAKKQEDEVTQGLMNLLSYDGTPQKAGE